MSFWYPDRDDWFRRFFERGRKFGRRGGFFDDIEQEFDEMRKEMERTYQEEFKDIEKRVPKEMVREYTTPEGAKVKDIGPIVYGYSMTIGPDGKPHVKEFGNVRSSSALGGPSRMISSEREPLVDITTSDKDVKVVIEMPGVKKENIKINAYDSSVEVTTDDPQRKYHEVIDLPPEANIETAKSLYNNGILEIVFNKKQQTKPAGKEIKID